MALPNFYIIKSENLVREMKKTKQKNPDLSRERDIFAWTFNYFITFLYYFSSNTKIKDNSYIK